MAGEPRLKIAIADYGHTRALKSGQVPIKGVDADFVQVVPIIAAFRRMVRDVEFDVCEMAPTTYMIARTRGAPYTALPIFLMRRFHHFVRRTPRHNPPGVENNHTLAQGKDFLAAVRHIKDGNVVSLIPLTQIVNNFRFRGRVQRSQRLV